MCKYWVVKRGCLNPDLKNVPGTVAYQERICGEGYLEERDGILILHLKGSPFEMGYQQGTLLKGQIHQGIRDYLYGGVINSLGGSFSRNIALQVLKKHAHSLRKYIPREYLKEMEGLAKGAEVPLEDVILLHTFLDTFSTPAPIIIKEGLPYPGNCTNFVVWGKASWLGELIHGRNLDYPHYSLAHKLATVIIYEPERGNRFASLAWVGIIKNQPSESIPTERSGVKP